MKTKLHTKPVNGGAFNCQPAREIELEDDNILCNNVTLPWETNPHGVRLWVIGNEFGALGAVWADCEQDAFDELCDGNLSGGLMVDDQDQDNEDGELAHLGNAGELHDLCNAWICQVDFQKERDCELLCQFAEARGNGQTNLYQ